MQMFRKGMKKKNVFYKYAYTHPKTLYTFTSLHL
jgi:hypothetical protein